MKKIAFFAAALVVAMTSCSTADNGTNETTDGTPIDFRPVVDKTRASLVSTTPEFTNFFVQADIDGKNDFGFLKASVYKESGAWTYSPKKYWPTTAGTKVSFYGYAPVKDVNMTTDLAISGGVVTFGYTVPVNQNVVNTATDLLVAHKKTLDSTTPTVNFDFTHALSAATFSAINKNDKGSEVTYVISKIELTNLNTVGTYTYGTGWTATSTPDTYVAGVPASGVAVYPSKDATYTNGVAVKLLSANDVTMVLPQTAAASAKIKITYSLKDGSGQYVYENNSQEFAFPASFAFTAGTMYNFTFTFDAIEPVVLNVATLTGWGTEVDIP